MNALDDFRPEVSYYCDACQRTAPHWESPFIWDMSPFAGVYIMGNCPNCHSTKTLKETTQWATSGNAV